MFKDHPIKVILFDVDKVLVQNLGNEHWDYVSALFKEQYKFSISGADIYQKIYYLGNKNAILNGLQNGSMSGLEYLKQVNQALKTYGCTHEFSLEEYYSIVFADRLNTCPQQAGVLAQEIKAFLKQHPHIQVGLITDRMEGDEAMFRQLLHQLYPDLFNNPHLNFFSSEVGKSKRGKDLFPHVIAQLKAQGYHTSEILVIDDRLENRLDAQAAGLKVKEYLWGSPAGEMTRILMNYPNL